MVSVFQLAWVQLLPQFHLNRVFRRAVSGVFGPVGALLSPLRSRSLVQASLFCVRAVLAPVLFALQLVLRRRCLRFCSVCSPCLLTLTHHAFLQRTNLRAPLLLVFLQMTRQNYRRQATHRDEAHAAEF